MNSYREKMLHNRLIDQDLETNYEKIERIKDIIRSYRSNCLPESVRKMANREFKGNPVALMRQLDEIKREHSRSINKQILIDYIGTKDNPPSIDAGCPEWFNFDPCNEEHIC